MSSFSKEQINKLQSTSKKVRWYRKIHRMLGIVVVLFLVVSSVTGILLAWKKNVNSIQPQTQNAGINHLDDWISYSQIEKAADEALFEHPEVVSSGIDRMDFRPEKSVVKVIYKKGYWEVQVNCVTGDILSVQKRYSDLFESIHDGSIIGDGFKLVSMNGLGISLLIMAISGFWLWFGPKKIKRIKSK